MLDIFGSQAQAYWSLGIPVIPLHPCAKKPIPMAWQKLASRMPTAEEQAYWLANYQTGNIGLVMGSQSGFCALDIDTYDPQVQAVIEALVPNSPWNRVGKKGKVMLFKWNGIDNFRIKNVKGEMLVELLSHELQIVIPPSIHPDTQRAYYADADLLDLIYNKVEFPTLPKDIEILLRKALEEAGEELSFSGWTRVTDWVSSGSRDVQMTAVAGHYANGITRGELSFRDAVDRMRAWHATCSEHVAGDEIDVEKGIHSLVQFLINDVIGVKRKPLPKGWDAGLDEDEKKKLGLKFDEKYEEWEFEKTKSYLLDQFNRHGLDSPESQNVIEEVLDRMSRSPNMTSLQQEQILKYICATNKNISLAAIRARFREHLQGDIKGTDHTEIAKAVLKEMEQTGLIRFHQGVFWRWGGSHWEKLGEGEILRVISENYGTLPAAKRATDHKGILAVLKNLVPQTLQDKSIQGINFANGLLTQGLDLVAHDPSYGMTYTLPFRYLPDSASNCPKFMSFLHSVWGEDEDYEEKVKALQEAMCVTLFGLGPSFARAILLYGLAKTGKTQLLRIVRSLVPDGAVSAVAPYQFSGKFEITQLAWSLLNICGELSEDKMIDGAHFKDVIDGSEQLGQDKGKPIFQFRPICTHWFASNHLPKTKDTSEGFNRRWLVLTFNHPIDQGAVVRDIGDSIVAEEREAIVAWVASIIKQVVQMRDFSLPVSHIQTMREIASDNDSVYFFLTSGDQVKIVPIPASTSSETGEGTDGLKTLHPTFAISSTKLHDEYLGFCSGGVGVRPVGLRKFSQRMRELAAILGFKIATASTGGVTEPWFVGLTTVKNMGARK